MAEVTLVAREAGAELDAGPEEAGLRGGDRDAEAARHVGHRELLDFAQQEDAAKQRRYAADLAREDR